MKFLEALKKAKTGGRQVVIPDIKRFSPKDGELLGSRKPAEYAAALIEAGAPVLSVVTEEKEFHGSLQMLKDIAKAAKPHGIPILRKDFINTKEDLIETRECGAAAILLMCSCLEPDKLRYLYREALELGLDPFVETHTEEDFALVRELGAELVGINNRDILKLERDDGDVGHTLSLIKQMPAGAFSVTESSIRDPEEVRMALRSGADAALVGTAIALAPDPGVFYRMLTTPTGLKICGLMNRQDIEMCVSAGVERIGLVTEYPLYVPWNLTEEKALELRRCIPKGFRAVMVTGGAPEKIIGLAERIRPDMVQLHYNETLEETAYIAAELKKLGIGAIKTVPVGGEACMQQFGTEDIGQIVKELCRTDTAELLVDPRHGSNVVRKDLQADEELFRYIKQISSKPVILAGGIGPDNISDILERTGAESVDIMNGSENAPGRKDPGKISKITAAIEMRNKR